MTGRELLFERRVKVIVASPLAEDFKSISAQTVEIDLLRVQFTVTKTLKKSANTASVQITNLSEKTRASLQAKGAKLVVSAGYLNTLAQIFIGDVRTIDHVRDGADWTTKIDSGDGERALSHARVSESFGAGAALPEVVKTIGDRLGIGLGNIQAKLAGDARQFVNGYTAHGRASSELDRVLSAAGYEWSIQDGNIQVLRTGETNTERVVVLSSDSGLVGSPTYGTAEKKRKRPVIKFKALLSPEIRPGGRVAFESLNHRGVHRVLRVTHKGDTAGGDWYTEGEVEGTES